MILDKLASAIRNDIVSGLQGYNTNYSISLEQLKDDIIDERLLIIQELKQAGTLPIQELLTSINCIDVKCGDITKCSSCSSNRELFGDAEPTLHFEIPQLMINNGLYVIHYLGSVDKQLPFKYGTSYYNIKSYSKYRRRNKNKPYVYIDPSPNANGMCDCYVFNAPLLKQVSITAVFKDPRQLDGYSCCKGEEDDNMSYINALIKERVATKKIKYYRQLAKGVSPNDQRYQAS